MLFSLSSCIIINKTLTYIYTRLSNAFKFTQTGYVSISVELYKPKPGDPAFLDDEDDTSILDHPTTTIECSPLSKDENVNPMDMTQYLFSVKDTGIGIPKSKDNKLFKSFSQVDASTTRNFGGTGNVTL